MLRKSIFLKLLIINIILMVSVILILTTVFSTYLDTFFLKQRENQMLQQADKIEKMVFDYYTGKMDKQQLTENINVIGHFTNTRILVVNKTDKIFQIYNGEENNTPQNSFYISHLAEIFEGNTVTNRKRFSKDLNANVVFVGLPVKQKGQVLAAVLMFSPVNDSEETLSTLYKTYWIIASLFITFMFIIIYIISKRITQPVVAIAKAAADIPQGKYIEDIEADRQDEIGQLSIAFNHMKNQLMQLEKLRADLIANVSHELRTPMTSIKGFVQAMLEGVAKPEQQEKYLMVVYKEINRVIRLVNDLLEVTKIQLGNIKLYNSSFQIEDLIKEVIDSISLTAENKGIKINACVKYNTDYYGDRDRIKQILINLVDNSIKHTGHGGTILIKTYKKQDRIYILVEDTGSGIPEEDIPFVFERFHKADKSRAASGTGTGLGLSIVKGLVELFGGNIEISSKLGEGTKATFYLPYQ